MAIAVTATISRNGDLINRAYLVITNASTEFMSLFWSYVY